MFSYVLEFENYSDQFISCKRYQSIHHIESVLVLLKKMNIKLNSFLFNEYSEFIQKFILIYL